MSRNGRVGVVVGGVILSALLAIVINQATGSGGLWAWVGVGLLLICSAVVAVMQANGGGSSAAARDEALEELARRSRHELRSRLRRQSLWSPHPMPVGWSSTMADLADQHGDLAGLTTRYATSARRRLVVLGEAGVGKSMLVRALAWHMLEARSAGEPVPVVLTLTEWDVDRHPSLWDWVARQVTSVHPFVDGYGTGTVDGLVRDRLILPILDGLDEVLEQERARLLSALAASLSTEGFVLSSRTDEYRDAVATADRVPGADAEIEVGRLDGLAIADYLEECVPPARAPAWTDTLAAVRAGDAAPLREVASTALGLWLVRAVYADRPVDPAPLIEASRFASGAALREHLFDELVPALVENPTVNVARSRTDLRDERVGVHRVRSAAQTLRWLRWVARLLELHERRDLRWWELAIHVQTVEFVRTGICLFLVLAPTIYFVHDASSVSGVAFGLIGGLLVGGIVGVPLGMAAGTLLQAKAPPAVVSTRLRGRVGALFFAVATRALAGLAIGIGLALVFSAVIALALVMMAALQSMDGAPAGDPRFGERIWPVARGTALVCLTLGAFAGVADWFTTPSPGAKTGSPTSTLRADLAMTGVRILALGAGGATTGLVTGQSAVAVLIIPLCVLFAVTRTAWFLYALTVFALAAVRRIPLGLCAFLDDAAELGLLRVAGDAYEFRHIELQHRLAGHGRAGESSTHVAAT